MSDESRADAPRIAGIPPPATDGPVERKPDRSREPEGPRPEGDAEKPGPSPGYAPPENPPAPPTSDEPNQRDGRPFLKRVEDDEQEWRQRQQNLRDLDEEEAPTRVGRDWIGRDANRVADGGSIYSATGDIWFVSGTSEQIPQIHYLLPNETSELTACLVEPPSHAELVESLDRDAIVFLRGAEGTGRRMAAIAALSIWVRATDSAAKDAEPGNVGIISGAASSLQRAGPDLRKHHGYVFEAANDHDAKRFDADAGALKYLALQSGCRIIVLAPVGWANLPGRIVDHRSPTAPEVFRRWMEHEAADAKVDVHLPDEMTTEIDDDLRLENLPGKAAQLARWLVGSLKAGRTPAELRAELPRRVRGDIRRRLDDAGPVLGRCFMASAVVLNGLPESTVSRAAMDLAEHINNVDSVTGEEWLPAWQHLGNWLEYADATTTPAQVAGVAPTVHLRRRVEIATLRVLWEDQPMIRQPLMAWLRGIAESDDPHAQTKAAHAAGVLATFDFDVAVTNFIISWSESRRLRDRRLAAMMLESAVGHPDIAPRVYRLLRELAIGTRGKRLIAAHAFGSRIGLSAPDIALRELRKIALSRDTEVGKAVAGSIGNLYSADTAGDIVNELVRWVNSGSPGGLYTSAMAFVRLAVIENTDPARPPLSQLGPDSQIGEQLAILWRNSLSFRIATSRTQYPQLVVPDSWIVLARWVSRYNEEPAIRMVIDELFSGSAGTQRLRSALQLHLRHWRYRNLVSADMHEHLIKMMKAG